MTDKIHSPVRDVKIMQVIRVESMIGDGENDPIRPYIEYFDMDGNLLKHGDIFNDR